MAITAVLYVRNSAKPRNTRTYPNLIDELKSSYIPDTDKIIFETSVRQFEGFQRRYRNRIRTVSHINTAGQLSQKNMHYGLGGYDLDIFGNFKDKSDVARLVSFEQRTQTTTDFENILGLYVELSDFLNIDPTQKKGYVLMESETGRVSRLSRLWDFKITLRFGGTL